MNLIRLWPTVVGETSLEVNPQEKQEYMKAIMAYLQATGFSNESTSDVCLQQNGLLQSLYSAIVKEIRQYLTSMNVNTDPLNVNIVKSWLNIVEEQHTPLHTHSESHFSFSFYLNIPEHYTQLIEFDNLGKHPTEPFRGFFQDSCNRWDIDNALSFSVNPKNNSLCIFPSDVAHRTIGDGVDGRYLEHPVKTLEELYGKRVCIAGDVLLTYKETKPSPSGFQPIENWKTF